MCIKCGWGGGAWSWWWLVMRCRLFVFRPPWECVLTHWLTWLDCLRSPSKHSRCGLPYILYPFQQQQNPCIVIGRAICQHDRRTTSGSKRLTRTAKGSYCYTVNLFIENQITVRYWIRHWFPFRNSFSDPHCSCIPLNSAITYSLIKTPYCGWGIRILCMWCGEVTNTQYNLIISGNWAVLMRGCA